MFVYQPDRCVKCGLCVKVCSYRTGNIRLTPQGISFLSEDCFLCGHCMAICPANAIGNTLWDPKESTEREAGGPPLRPEQLDFAIRFRRSLRLFTEQLPSEAVLRQVIQAGRYAPSGGNRQKIRYIILQKRLEEFRALVVSGFEKMLNAGTLLEVLNGDQSYLEKWREIIAEDRQGRRVHDRFLFHGNTVLLLVGPEVSTLEAGMASQNMDLMANALGMGCCYVGFIRKAAACLPEIPAFLGLEEGERVLNAMVIGYPAVAWKRTAVRKQARVELM